MTLVVLCGRTHAQDDDDTDGLPPGLVATYYNGATLAPPGHLRIDDDVAFDWQKSSPDPRLAAGAFSVRWRGSLFVSIPGSYRFHVHQAGTARLRIADAAIDATSAQAAWSTTVPVTLDFGYHNLTLEYQTGDATRRIGLYWTGPGFALEPVGPEVLFHDQTPTDAERFSRGHELVRTLRCDRCHRLNADGRSDPAPALTHLGKAVAPPWLRAWLRSPRDLQPHARMPDYDWTDDDIESIAAYLTTQAKSLTPPTPRRDPGDLDAGRRLFRNRGCLACHQLGDLGSHPPFGGGDLTRVAAKRTAGFLRSWLSKPAATNPDHRMPNFKLSAMDRDNLTTYLLSLVPVAEHPAIEAPDVPAPDRVARGRELITRANCAACHRIPNLKADEPSAGPLHGKRKLDWQRACTGDPDPATSRPGYRLDAAQREAIRAYVEALPETPYTPSDYARGADLLHRRGCLACHPRAGATGLVEVAGKLAGVDPELAGQSETLIPPSLNAVGDKLERAYLEQAVAGKAPRRLPWLGVPMPTFTHTPEERNAIVAHLIGHDRIPAGAPSRDESAAPNADRATIYSTGRQLVGPGFSCTACHVVGGRAPRNLALATRGSELAGIGRRMRRSWFDRWIHSPTRIVPGVEMPAYIEPAPDILAENFNQQLSAIWIALNDPAFAPPTSDGAVQQQLVVTANQPPEIVRDVFANGPPHDGWTARALAIGFDNRHNVLFDLDTFTLRKWWYGDFARQRTQGKNWFWESAGTTLLFDPRTQPPIALVHNGKLEHPVRERQTIGWLRNWRQWENNRVAMTYSLRFSDDRWLDVTETVATTHSTGFTRSIQVQGVPKGTRALWLHRGKRVNDRTLELDAEISTAQWQLPDPDHAWQQRNDPGLPPDTFAVELDPATDRDGVHAGKLLASSSLHFDASPTPDASSGIRTAETLNILDGYGVHRLALPDHIMPTALTWRDDGTLVVASLQGDILLVRDTDGDGIEDLATPFAKHLAAPFGLAIDGDDILVSHKPEILRLRDTDGDGRADLNEVVATGWGFNDNYHDWTFGLPRDAAGNFYVTLGSDYQQRERPASQSRFRGHVLRISAEGTLTSIATGLRFTCGLAMNGDGEIFFTDNQGVQNPFNEINHLIEGEFYGVPARHDDHVTGNVRPPAVCLPHPMTRSVNGLVFIPPDNRPFAPFTGQGIGCEYDNEMLIRFSLQRVGDTYQGAVYPFTHKRKNANDGRLQGTMTAGVSPDGDLYVGTFLDSGWLGGPNRGGLIRIHRTGAIPTGIREVRATADGFTIDFTNPIDAAKAADADRYTLSAYRRLWQGGYATPDRDRHEPRIKRVTVDADHTSVHLELETLEPGFVYDLAVKPITADNQPLNPATAHYTLNVVPKPRRGESE